MKRPIGFDVEHLQKKIDNLDTEESGELVVEHVTRLSGAVLAIGGVIGCILETQSVAQQEKILEGLLARMESAKALTLKTSGSKRLLKESLEHAKTFIDLLQRELKGKS